MALLCKVRRRPRPANHTRGSITGHGVLGAASMAAILLHSPTDIFPAVAAVSIILFVVGTLVRDPMAPPVMLEYDPAKSREIEKPAKIANDKVRVISRTMTNVKITDGQACYFHVNGKPVRVAWTLPPHPGAASSNFKLIAKLESTSGLSVTGPYYTPQSRYACIPKSLIIFCTDATFAEAHSLLHARGDRHEDLSTTVVWIDPTKWLRELFDKDHNCCYRGSIEETCTLIQPLSHSIRLGRVREPKTTLVNPPPIPRHFGEVADLQYPGKPDDGGVNVASCYAPHNLPNEYDSYSPGRNTAAFV